jgi:hypothetical protein
MNLNAIRRSEIQFIWVLIALVILFGIPMLSSFQADHHEVAASVAIAEKEAPRAPASASVTPMISATEKIATFKLNCKDKSPSQEVSSNYLRIFGSLCGLDSESVQITNSSNGFQASIFMSENDNFSTDFIDLQEGENQLQVNFLDADGHKMLKTLHIYRKPLLAKAASN